MIHGTNAGAFFSIMGSTLISGIMMTLISGQHEAHWYDFYHDYYTFPKESTDAIDRMLVRTHGTNSKIGTIRIITPEYWVPDEGYHYFYRESDRLFWLYNGYLGLCKKREIIGTSEVYTYSAWVSPFHHNLINWFKTMIQGNQNQTAIQVFVIDTTSIEPQNLYVEKIYKEPTELQKSTINKILEHWDNPGSNYNTKVFLYGQSGVGKTYTSYGLKKTMEKSYGINPMLYDDFNPSVIGSSIQKILANARQDMPVIIVMNEIDVSYKKVFAGEQSFDPRGSYTKDKTSFNNMLDYISSIRHCIIIFTSEKSPQQLLNESERYGSFLRKGRVDLFIEMKDPNNQMNKNLTCHTNNQ